MGLMRRLLARCVMELPTPAEPPAEQAEVLAEAEAEPPAEEEIIDAAIDDESNANEVAAADDLAAHMAAQPEEEAVAAGGGGGGSGGTYACCDSEHNTTIWNCSVCTRWFHRSCARGAKGGDPSSPLCMECLLTAQQALAEAGVGTRKRRRP